MFWGISCESGKKYSQMVDASYHISMASLEPKDSSYANKEVSLMVEHKKNEFLVCTLEYNRVMQVNLDLMFKKGEDVTFFLNGEGSVHLTGYMVEDEESDTSFSIDEESEEELVENKSKKKNLMTGFNIADGSSIKKSKKDEIKKGKKKLKGDNKNKAEIDKIQIAKPNKLVTERIASSVSPLKKETIASPKKGISPSSKKQVLATSKKESLTTPKKQTLSGKKVKDNINGIKKVNSSKRKEKVLVHSDEEEDDSSDDEEEEDEDIEEEEEEDDDSEIENDSLEDEEEDLEEEEDEEEEVETVKPTGGSSGTKRGNDITSTNEAKRVKTEVISPSNRMAKKLKKDFLIIGEKEDLEDDDSDDFGELESSIGRTPMPPKKVDSIEKMTPAIKLDFNQDPAPASKKKKKSKKKNKNKTAQSDQMEQSAVQPEPSPVSRKKWKTKGVEIEDIRIGSGPVAVPPKRVNIYYVGKLENNEVFDSRTKGSKGFEFKLFQTDVIRGLQIGVEGMKVGGKRNITVPPHRGYGDKKHPKIPPGSTLYFTVELRYVI